MQSEGVGGDVMITTVTWFFEVNNQRLHSSRLALGMVVRRLKAK